VCLDDQRSLMHYIALMLYNFFSDGPLEIGYKEDEVSKRESIADFGQPYIAMAPGVSGDKVQNDAIL
jgi:hypothetical protein